MAGLARWTLITTLFVLTACHGTPTGSVTQQDDAVTIGVLMPLTGETAKYGTSVKRGIELALDELPADLRNRIDLIYKDTKCKPKTGVSSMQHLITAERVDAVTGIICSSTTLAVAPIANRNGIPTITHGASDAISNAGEHVFRIFPRNTQFVKALLPVLDDAHRIGVVYVNNDYGVGLRDAAQQLLDESIVFTAAHDQDQKDYRTTLRKLKRADLDAVVLATYYTNAGLLLKQAGEVGLDTRFVGTDGLDNHKLIDIAGSEADGVVFATLSSAAGPSGDAFRRAYREKYGEAPGWGNDIGYDAMHVVANAVRSGHTDSQSITDYLNAVHYRGASTTITFDDNGDLTDPAVTLKTVRNGSITPYTQ